MVERIITNRLGYKEYYWQIVYEWEDVLSKELGVPLSYNFFSIKIVRRILGHLPFPSIIRQVPATRKLSLAFVMRPGVGDYNIYCKKNIIPVIIDFWSRSEDEIKAFAERYSKNPAVIVTSREVYEFLKVKLPGMRIHHWALSLPDKYFNLPMLPKKYDCACVGRPSFKLSEWMQEYAKEHPDFIYVYNNRVVGGKRISYVASNGEDLNELFNTRWGYFNVLRKTKVGLYSTPSMDGDKVKSNGIDSNGFNQVTPRLLEYLAAGCSVLARYEKNPDTDWFNLDSVAYNVATYDDFSRLMDRCRGESSGSKRNHDYVRRHLTSVRAEELKRIVDLICSNLK